MSDMDEENRIHVDEDWKKSVAEEKARLREQEEATRAQTPHQHQAAADEPLPQPSVAAFMAGLYTQTLAALGQIENPLTGKKERRKEEAQYLIDTIAMLAEKMAGNITAEEEAYISRVLYDLRMRYVSEPPPPDAAEGKTAD